MTIGCKIILKTERLIQVQTHFLDTILDLQIIHRANFLFNQLSKKFKRQNRLLNYRQKTHVQVYTNSLNKIRARIVRKQLTYPNRNQFCFKISSFSLILLALPSLSISSKMRLIQQISSKHAYLRSWRPQTKMSFKITCSGLSTRPLFLPKTTKS